MPDISVSSFDVSWTRPRRSFVFLTRMPGSEAPPTRRSPTRRQLGGETCRKHWEKRKKDARCPTLTAGVKILGNKDSNLD